MRLARVASLLLFIACGRVVSAQDNTPWGSSGNGMLTGTYNFRHVAWILGDQFGDLSRSIALYGSITFNGSGSYSLTGTAFDSSQASSVPITTSGTYKISGNGLGFLTSPIQNGGFVWGTVSQGIFIGSSTESGFNDMFIASPVPTPNPTTATFNGPYWIAEMGLNPSDIRDAMFQINPDGQGNLGTLNVSGYTGTGGATVVSQTLAGGRYAPAGTALLFTYGGTPTANLVAGSRLVFISPDGNFIFGGSTNNSDFFVGVRAPTGSVAPDGLQGLYYQAGLDEDLSSLASGLATLSTYYGTFQAQTAASGQCASDAGVVFAHERLLTNFDGFQQDYLPFDYTYSECYTLNQDGTQDDFLNRRYVVGAGGAFRIGFGKGVMPGLTVAARVGAFHGSGVFLNPAGVTNFASSAPFSVGVSGGEFISLTGTGLATTTKFDSTFPTTLGGVQVLINGRLAPLYYVSSNQIVAIVPYATSGAVTSIQAISNTVPSNSFTVFVNNTTPGVFSTPMGGAGYAIAQHLDYTLVTPAHPASPGEIVLVYSAGLGNVSPAVADGVQAPLSTLSPATSPINVYVDQEKAAVLFDGLVPTEVADYALVFLIPSDIQPGNAFLDVAGPDSYSSQVTIPIGAATPAAKANATIRKPRRRPTGIVAPKGSLDTSHGRVAN